MSEDLSWTVVVTAVLAGAVRRGTPMAFAAVGEALAERAGIINLGVEGMMLVGAMVSVVVQASTGNAFLAVLCAGLAAFALAAIHAVLVIKLNADQIVSGFALTVLGTGLSGFFGRPYVGAQIDGVAVVPVPFLADIPVLGEILFQHDPLTYLSILLAVAMWIVLRRTRFGLHVRAVGEAPQAAYAQGVPVNRVRFLAVALGGSLAGLGGAHLAIAYTQVWSEHMTAGQGWIAVGLVIVAGWRPLGCLAAAWFFGALAVLHPHLQAAGVEISPYLIAQLPYLITIAALVVATLLHSRRGYGLPAALAKRFRIGET